MHLCQDEIIAIDMAIASIPFIGLGWHRLKARLALRRSKCEAPKCDGHPAPEKAPKGGDLVKAE